MGLAPAGAAPAARLQAPPSFGAAPVRSRPISAAPPALRPRFTLLVDLGRDIGSPEWLRGLATCLLLCLSAWSFWPEMSTTPGLAPAQLSADQWEEASAVAILPIAEGSTTGRRMAPTDAVQPLLNAPERPSVELRASLAAAGDLTGALLRAGVSQAEADQVAAMVGRLVPLAEIGAGTILDLRLGRRERISDPRPLEQLSLRASFALKVDIRRVDGRLVVTPIPIGVDTTPLRIQGYVGASLYRSARAAGVPARAVETYIRVLASQLNMPSGLTAGDRFDIVVENRRAETGESQSGALLYAGLDRATGSDLQLMPWASGAGVQWFEASGVGRESSSGFRLPVEGRITSSFGYRTHPILGYRRMHSGMDFGAPYGAPIVAAAAGQVSSAGWYGGYGRTVQINHGSGISTLYGHMSRLAVAPGQSVVGGQVIGYVGSTGFSTGPHLHYELHRGGQPVDPASFRFTTRSQLAGGDLEAFRGRMRAFLMLPVGAAAPVQSATATTSAAPAPLPRPPVPGLR